MLIKQLAIKKLFFCDIDKGNHLTTAFDLNTSLIK